MIKDQWAPAIQRERDRSIMERFCKLSKSKCGGATAGQLRMANEVRIWLRVITVADLVNVGGTCKYPITQTEWILEELFYPQLATPTLPV